MIHESRPASTHQCFGSTKMSGSGSQGLKINRNHPKIQMFFYHSNWLVYLLLNIKNKQFYFFGLYFRFPFFNVEEIRELFEAILDPDPEFQIRSVLIQTLNTASTCRFGLIFFYLVEFEFYKDEISARNIGYFVFQGQFYENYV